MYRIMLWKDAQVRLKQHGYEATLKLADYSSYGEMIEEIGRLSKEKEWPINVMETSHLPKSFTGNVDKFGKPLENTRIETYYQINSRISSWTKEERNRLRAWIYGRPFWWLSSMKEIDAILEKFREESSQIDDPIRFLEEGLLWSRFALGADEIRQYEHYFDWDYIEKETRRMYSEELCEEFE